MDAAAFVNRELSWLEFNRRVLEEAQDPSAHRARAAHGRRERQGGHRPRGLQARFDEEANIRWARTLEEVGAHVVYGRAGFKTHGKACLVVREEARGLRRYCHLATGNYNARTGGVYGDLGLFTSRDSFGADLSELFDFLIGGTRPRAFHHLLLAPGDLREGLVARIRREADHARAGRPARIIAKMNSLVDRRLIEELYAASEASVRIDLIVRGICCLRPEVPGLSFWLHRWVPALLLVTFVAWVVLHNRLEAGLGGALRRQWRRAWPSGAVVLIALLFASTLAFVLDAGPATAKIFPVSLNVVALSMILFGTGTLVALPRWLGGSGPSPFLDGRRVQPSHRTS